MPVSMSSAEATPSASMRMASSPTATPSREVANPGESRTSMTVLPSDSAQSWALTTWAGSRSSCTTSSRSACTGTGLKKCMTMTSSPRLLIDREDVLEASRASGHALRTSARTRRLSATSSGTASMTSSVVLGSWSTAATTSRRSSSWPAGLSSLPRCSALSSEAATASLAAAARSSPASATVTWLPAARRTCAMPAPMVPPPTTAAFTTAPYFLLAGANGSVRRLRSLDDLGGEHRDQLHAADLGQVRAGRLPLGGREGGLHGVLGLEVQLGDEVGLVALEEVGHERAGDLGDLLPHQARNLVDERLVRPEVRLVERLGVGGLLVQRDILDHVTLLALVAGRTVIAGEKAR